MVSSAVKEMSEKGSSQRDTNPVGNAGKQANLRKEIPTGFLLGNESHA